jgi:hypothetical protein
MLHRSSIAAMVLAAALGATIASAQAWDDARYPDLKGEWVRGYPGLARFDPAKGLGPRQEAPLTAEYQALYQANLAEQAQGGKASTQRIAVFRPACRGSCTCIRQWKSS